MKGKLYKPQSQSVPSLKIRNSSINHKINNASITSLECIWPSSIPDSWKRIFKKKNLQDLKISKINRKTFNFLQETQKYIETIRKPISNNEVFIAPRSGNTSRASVIRSKLLSASPTPAESRVQETKLNFMRRRRKQFKPISSVPELNGVVKISLKPRNIKCTSGVFYREYN